MAMKREQRQSKHAMPAGKWGWMFLGILALTVLPDFFLQKKGYFYAVEGWPGFFALLGMAATGVLLLLGRLLWPLLRREEDADD
jgi:hypothetical protein